MDTPKIGRVLRFRVDTDWPADLPPQLLRELNDFVKRRDLELTVIRMRSKREPFARTQRLDLRQREVFAEPPRHGLAVNGLCTLAIGIPVCSVGRAADFVLVPGNQDAVLRRDKVWLDEIGAHLDTKTVRFE